MTTSPRELVRETLEFASPERVPRQLWLLPWAGIHHADMVKEIQARFPDDLVHAPGFCADLPRTEGDPYAVGQYVDDWGCTFSNLQAGIIGEVKEPLLDDWSKLDLVRPPVECLSIDRGAIDDFCRKTDRFVIAGCCPRPFERLQFLRGSENLYYDLADRPAGLGELLARVHAFYLEELQLWAETDVDALMFMDDWGSQSSMLISPKMWRELFLPLYVEYVDIAHGAGKYAMMHSDGYILDILPDLADIGLDAVNSQVFCMGLAELGSKLRGKITFWGEMDRQHLLPRATREEIIESTREMKRELYQGGGVIAQCEFGPGAKPENVFAFFEAWEDL